MVASKKSSSIRVKSKQTAVAKEKKPTAKRHAGVQPSATATIDRREKSDRRASDDRRTLSIPVDSDRRTTERRAKVSRRRQIDPTTCERDYTPEEVEFMGAMDAYKRRSGRMFPTCSEVLEVIKSLGYEKRPQVEVATVSGLEASAPASELATVS